MSHVASNDRRNAIRALNLALGAFVLFLILPYVSGLLGAAVLYVIAAPLMRGVVGRKRHAVAFVTVFFLFVALVLPVAWLLVALLAQVPDAVTSVQQSAFVERAMAARIGSFELGGVLRQASSEVVGWSSRQTMTALGEIVSATLNLVIALFGTYYLLVSGRAIWLQLVARLPFAPATSEHLRVRFHRVTEAMLLGVVTTCLVQGTLVGVAFQLIGVEHALLWGALTALTSILPMFGSALVWAPASLVLAAQGRLDAALGLLAFGVVIVSNVDNVVRLIVYRRVSQIHPMVTLVGAFAGVNVFGIAGLLLGPLVLSYALELIRNHHVPDDAASAEPDPPGRGIPQSARVISPTPSEAIPA
jgi:predicted PurR-regulated permease PerM